MACDISLNDGDLDVDSELDDYLDDDGGDNSLMHLEKTRPDELDFDDDMATLEGVAFVDEDQTVDLGAISVAVLAPDLKAMTTVPDGSGLTKFKDLDMRWNLIKAQNFLLAALLTVLRCAPDCEERIHSSHNS